MFPNPCELTSPSASSLVAWPDVAASAWALVAATTAVGATAVAVGGTVHEVALGAAQDIVEDERVCGDMPGQCGQSRVGLHSWMMSDRVALGLGTLVIRVVG